MDFRVLVDLPGGLNALGCKTEEIAIDRPVDVNVPAPTH